MQYRMYGDQLQLIKYVIKITTEDKEVEINILTDKEKAAMLEKYPDAVIEEVDNTGYVWLDGMVFTQEQLVSGELERAIAMGESAYKAYLAAIDRDQQILDLDYRLSCLELGIRGGEMQ